jgi:hypothetical protein
MGVVDGEVACVGKSCHGTYAVSRQPVAYGFALANWIILSVGFLVGGLWSVYLAFLRWKAPQDPEAARRFEVLQRDLDRRLAAGSKLRSSFEIPNWLAVLVIAGAVVILLVLRAYSNSQP